jgi:PAS domain S-box-containing protein
MHRSTSDGLAFSPASPGRRGARGAVVCALVLLSIAHVGTAAEFVPPKQLVVVTDISFPPYLFQTDDGHLQGILQDKWALWSRLTGVPVRLEGMEWSKAQESVLQGNADVIEALAYTEARTRLYEYSPPYAPIEAHVYFHHNISGIHDVESMRGFTVGAKDGSACGNWLSERGISIHPFPTSQAVVKAAGAGEVRLFCMDAPAAQYFLFKLNVADDFRQTPPLYSTQFHWAVRKGATELRDFIQQGFGRITPEELASIDSQWIGNPLRFPIPTRYVYYVMLVAAGVLGATIALLLWNRSLSLRVATRTAELRTALTSLQEHSARVIDLYNNAPCGYHSLDAAGLFVEINDTELHWLGYTREELIGKRGLADFLTEASRRRFEEKFAAFKQSADAVSNLEYEIVRRNGAVMSVLLSSAVIRDKDGNYAMSRTTVYDVTERKRAERQVLLLNAELEQRIAERTAQLTLANQELAAANDQLESFSYSVSHDLRAPLRHIDAFSKMLKDRAQNLDETSRGYLDTISRSARWMGRLVDDLLALARAARSEINPARLDLEKLVESARAQCLQEVRDRDIEWRIARLPEVQGDWTLLKTAFVNLLDNSIKFTRRREHAVIEVGTVPGENGEVVVYVKDNGAGFDMRYAEKLFGVFQRMHGQEDFEGTGVGLATVQRIVARHGGQIWAHAEPDKGATFFVELRPATTVH